MNYQDLYNDFEITDENSVVEAAKLILKNKERYMNVVEGTKLPWQFVGVTHYREASCDFTCHPHNGDSLKQRTHNVPAGRPLAGDPPFTWEESAKDCYITLKQLDKIQEWDIPTILSALEAFNGWGYKKYHPDVLSPYLWSFTDKYTVGKYASDGKFDPTLKDKQVGTVPLYKFLTDKTLGLV